MDLACELKDRLLGELRHVTSGGPEAVNVEQEERTWRWYRALQDPTGRHREALSRSVANDELVPITTVENGGSLSLLGRESELCPDHDRTEKADVDPVTPPLHATGKVGNPDLVDVAEPKAQKPFDGLHCLPGRDGDPQEFGEVLETPVLGGLNDDSLGVEGDGGCQVPRGKARHDLLSDYRVGRRRVADDLVGLRLRKGEGRSEEPLELALLTGIELGRVGMSGLDRDKDRGRVRIDLSLGHNLYST